MIDMYVGKNKDIAFRIIEGEAIILTPEDGRLHNLNPVATRIFELANGRRKIRDIINLICEEFEVSRDIAQRDTLNFIEDLVHRQLLIFHNRPTKSSS